MTVPGTRTRHRLLSMIAASPGISHLGIVKASGLADRIVAYHLDILVIGGDLTCRLEGRNICYYPREHAVPEVAEISLRDNIPFEGISLAQLERCIQVPRSLIRRELSRLISEGRVVRRGLRRPRYYPVPVPLPPPS